ncbi:unnamed protein product [Nippostrongylus brasiliensis]|uniref:K1107 n=1 Tax=Nippostrongylus brasiliensis TaxID=27835 RepID=A0A0N4Y6R1_NIPBR|nr:unnamed protein product [Nippostrongylus brasiliensis]
MDKFIRRDSLSTKLCEAIEKRNSPSGQNDSSGKSSAVPSRSASPNVAPLPSKITSKIEENKASAPVSATQPSPSPNASKAASPLAVKKEPTATNATSQQKNGTSTAKADLVPTISKGSQAKNSDTSKAASPSTVGKNPSTPPSKDSATPLTKAEERPKSPGFTQLKTTEENTPTNRKQAGKEHEASAEPRQQGRGSPAVEKRDSTSCGNIYLDTETKKESNPCQEKVAPPDDLNKNSFETSASFSIPTNAKGSQEHSTGSIKQGSVPPLPIVVTSSIEDQTDRASRGKTSEPSTAVTILLTGINKRNRSRSVSPGRRSHQHRHQKEESPQLLTVSPNQHQHHKHEHHSRQSASPTMDRADQSIPQADDDSRKGRRKRRDPTRTLDNLKEKLATEKSHNNGGQNGTNALSESGASTSSTGSEEGVSLNETQNRVVAPLLLVTEPKSPHKTCPEEWEESTDADWTEAEDEADYESDFEYSVSQTFSLKDAMPIGDLYPLSRCSSRCSPFVSDYDSDSSMPLFTLPSRAAESRGRVDHLFAVPPPSFTCSITYDGQESWDDDSLHSCTEFDDDYYGRHSRFSRAGSSALGAYLSPGTYSSDEDFDGQHFHDEVDVGCTLRLVDKAALKGDSDDDDSEYYDDEEYSDEEYWDEDEEYDEEEGEYEEDEEYDEDEEELEEDEEESCDEMHSFAESGDEESLRSPYPLIVVQPVDDEEFVDMEEMDAEFDVEATVEIALPETVKPPEETTEKHREITYTKDMIIMTEEERAEQLRIDEEEAAKAIKKRVVKDGTSEKAAKTVVPQHVDVEEEVMDMEEMEAEFEVETVVEHALPEIIKEPEEKTEKYREVTYTKDLSLMTEEEKAEQLRIEQEQAEKAIKKRVVKDGASEKAGATRVPQRVVPLEETVALDESIVLPDEEICELGLQQHEDETGKHEVNVVPTFVRPLTEKIQEESASRFADKRVATDFAKKAVIQPPKLQTAAVQKVEAKIAPEKPIEPPSKKTELQKKVDESKTKNDVKRADETKAKDQAAAAAKVAPTSTASSKAAVDVKSKTVEDKSGTRKSALNMTAEDAKRKAAADEEAAKQKARRFGTVSSMLNRFKEPEVKEEPITYKRSSYLEAKEVERPKKKYQVIKPAVDDSFDKQMEEIRKQMKSGSSQFESHLKDLSKGITATAEDMKKRTEDEKKKIIIDSVSGVFSKADEEKARWKEKRDAATEKELAKIEADKPIKKKVVAKQEKEEPEKKAEPKRTVRKIVKDKVPAAATGPVPSFATVPKPAVAPSVAAAPPVSKTAAATTKPVTTSTAPPAQPTPTELPNKVENVAAKAAAAAAKAKAATAPSVKVIYVLLIITVVEFLLPSEDVTWMVYCTDKRSISRLL